MNMNGQINKKYMIKYLLTMIVLFSIGCQASQQNVKSDLNPKTNSTITAEDYLDDAPLQDDVEIASEKVCLMFGRAQLLVLSMGQNICVKISTDMDQSFVTIYELIERSITQPKLGQKLEQYQLPDTVKFNTLERYFYYDYARRVDFYEEDIRLRTVDKNPNADIIILRRDGTGRKGLIDLVKNGSHMQLHYKE